MWRRLAALGCMLLMLLTPVLAGAAEPGMMAREFEAEARAQGMEVKTETTFAWGGLPLLSDEENKALASLLKVLTLQSRAQGAEDGGYRAYDMLLQDVSVLDIVMQAADGVYYEQSNLLGGQTVAFTPEEFSTFMARMSARSEGSLPANLDTLFTALLQALNGGDIQLDAQTYEGAMQAFAVWQNSALVETEQLRPSVRIPGLYGVRAVVVDLTREEALDFARIYSDLLAENDALWREAATSQLPEGSDEATLDETAQKIAQTMRDLPKWVELWWPQGVGPMELRTVYGPDDEVVSRQLDLPLSDTLYFYAEWVPQETGVPPLYGYLAAGDSSLELLVTHEKGEATQSDKETNLRNRSIAQLGYQDEQMRLDVTMTRTQDVKTIETRETITTQTDFLVESAALFGEGMVLTLSAQTTQSTRGETGKYANTSETVWRIKGLGFDKQNILTVTSKTTLQEATLPADPAVEAIHPAQMTDEELDAWFGKTQVSMVQVVYTILGRLPADVAEYVLNAMQ